MSKGRWVGGALPLLAQAFPARADGFGLAPASAGPEVGTAALVGLAAAITWHFVAGQLRRAHAPVPALAWLHLDRLGRRARRLVRRLP